MIKKQLQEKIEVANLEELRLLLQKFEELLEKPKKPVKKLYGLFKEKISISDDFDEPLDDFKEYM